jgi:hypothetical protein
MVVKNAGATIRELASKRRETAILHFAGAGVLVIFSPFTFHLFGRLGVLAFVFCVVGAYIVGCSGLAYWEKADRADQGARGEEQLERSLESLKQQGWSIEYNLELRWGDGDAFLRSPKGNHYVIDAKAHENGTIFFDPHTKMLMRRYGRDTVHDLGKNHQGAPKDLLKAVKGQAKEIKEKRQLRWITPILCFTQAEIDSSILPEQPVEGVHISRLSGLPWLLQWLDNRR